MAEKLAEAGIKTTVIPDTAIFAVIPRVHKAFLSKFLTSFSF
jgi:translation initiation factor 2B subunit (eIF-2B alpha/beta/delta family)